ncbi:MAG: hypothetical protein V1808_02375 [Candidatus Daviesbacteria bacterium]
MTLKKVVLISLVFLVILIVLLLRSHVSIRGNQIQNINSFSSGNYVSPTPSPTVTPTPIIFNANSNLEEELKKLSPEDFLQDFDSLKQ